jgi:two-component system, OmpR family, response regulator
MRTIRILIIDDDPDICDYMRLMLSRQGYEVESNVDPEEGLNMLRENEFHLLILDLMMPKIHGTQMLEEIRKFDKDISIIISTGYPSVDTAVLSLRYKVADYIKKPFDLKEFEQSVERILREKGLLIDPEEALLQTIGRNIREARKNKNLTLKETARRTGLSVSLLSQIERAESSASVSSLFKLANALDCTITDFFGEF